MMREECSLCILAGGQSSRFGGNEKGLMEIQGRPIPLIIAERFATFVSHVKVVAKHPEKLRSLGLPVIADGCEEYSPIAGLIAALRNTATPWVAILSCDLPNATPAILEEMWRLTPNAQAVVPQHDDGKMEPLCALYSTQILPLVERSFALNPSLSLHCLLRSLRTLHLSQAKWETLPFGARLFDNLNTPEDLVKYRNDPP